MVRFTPSRSRETLDEERRQPAWRSTLARRRHPRAICTLHNTLDLLPISVHHCNRVLRPPSQQTHIKSKKRPINRHEVLPPARYLRTRGRLLRLRCLRCPPGTKERHCHISFRHPVPYSGRSQECCVKSRWYYHTRVSDHQVSCPYSPLLYLYSACPDLQFHRAFACTGPAKAFQMVTALTSKFHPTIEDDQVVSIMT
jgi:hypothetical protein